MTPYRAGHVSAVEMPAVFPLPKPIIVLVCLFFPIWGSSILYWVWKGSHPEAARFALRTGWLLFAPWLVIGVIAGATGALKKKDRGVDPAKTSETRGKR